MKTRIVITNGDLGSDNTLFFTYDPYSWQGRKRIQYWAEFLATRSGKSVECFTYFEWREKKTPRPFMRVGFLNGGAN
jgi:hypothetical protein